MALTVNTDKEAYAPGETVTVSGSVRDAESGGSLSGAIIEITVENTDISTFATYYATDYSGQFNLPKDFSEGAYTVKVTASSLSYPAVSKTTSFTVGPLEELKFTIKLDPEKSSEDAGIKKFNHFNTFYPTENILRQWHISRLAFRQLALGP